MPAPAGTSVVPGSVTTSTGTVNGGSGVSVNVGTLPFLGAATIGFDLLIGESRARRPDLGHRPGHRHLQRAARPSHRRSATPAAANDPTVIAIGRPGRWRWRRTPGVPGPSIGDPGTRRGHGHHRADRDLPQRSRRPPARPSRSWTVSYRLEGDTNLTQLAAGTGTTVDATIDPTVLPNGAYVIEVRAEGSAGGVSIAETSIVVEGELKLGRFEATYQDLAVPVAGMPMQVSGPTTASTSRSATSASAGASSCRTSGSRRTGPLGQGGWRMFGCGRGFIFVPLCFETRRAPLRRR